MQLVPSPISRKFYFIKVVVIIIAVTLLIYKSDTHFSKFSLVTILLILGFVLGKLTCNLHYENAGLGVTIIIFILMNLLHSFMDGISFTSQTFGYWISAVGAHEGIRQPTLYIMLWTILQPLKSSVFSKIITCFMVITIVWVLGSWLGTYSGASLSRLHEVNEWLGYSIFLFIGDIVHHLADQYQRIKERALPSK